MDEIRRQLRPTIATEKYLYRRCKQRLYPRRQLRPVITTEPAHSPAEAFQNATLRPILKLQHELLVSLYRHFLSKRKVAFHNLSRQRQLDWIAESLSTDNRLRGIILGMVIGHFTAEELTIYLQQETELRKRIMHLATQRLQSAIDQLR